MLEKEIYQYKPNYKSVSLLMELFTYLKNYGFDITGIIIKVHNQFREQQEFITTDEITEFITDTERYLRRYYGTTDYNLFLLTFFEVDNRNLDRYQNRFVVDLNDLENINIKKVNTLDKNNQHIIDREVDRYMNLIYGLLTDYRVKYKLSYQAIEKEQNDEDNNSYNNYVDGNYIIPIDYVKPQIN